MTKKQPHVPETHDVKPNREQRRHPEGRPQDHPLARDGHAPKQVDVPELRGKTTTDR